MSEPRPAPSDSLWAGLRDARPQRVPHASVHRRQVRGETWAIVHNAVSGAQVRVNDPAFGILSAMDGRLTLDELVRTRVPAADAGYREAIAETLLTLESSGLVRLDRASDAARLVARAREHSRSRRKAFDPLCVRLPLLDPDRALGWLHARVRFLASKPLFVILLVLYASGVLVATTSWPAITAELSRVAHAPSGWWLYVLLYPVLKFIHELAHGLCVKHHGGAVHEAGISVLVLMPVPYVDASDSARFERRGQRLAVSAAGMVLEGAIACAALTLWSLVEAGPVRDVAFATALLGSLSTVLFNANPLLRFDGYHLLQDLLDIPNLGTRSSAFLGACWRRHVLRANVATLPVTAPGERRWLLGYGLASLGYRWILTLAIALWLLFTVPHVGAVLAVFALWKLLGRPVLRGMRYLRESAELDGCRRRVTTRVTAAALTAIAAVVWIPVPASTRAEGVVQASVQASLHAPLTGSITEVARAAGAQVPAGGALLTLDAPELHARNVVLAARIAVLSAERTAALVRDPVDAASLAADLAVARSERATIAREVSDLSIKSPAKGRFAPAGGRLATGRRVERGELLGHVVQEGDLRVAAIVEQHAIGRVQAGVSAVRVRLAERARDVLDARIVAESPAGDRQLPSPSLAGDGTRGIAVASGRDELLTVAPVFHVEVALPGDAVASGIGARAYVTFVHAPESLGRRWWRATRQLFLEKLSV